MKKSSTFEKTLLIRVMEGFGYFHACAGVFLLLAAIISAHENESSDFLIAIIAIIAAAQILPVLLYFGLADYLHRLLQNTNITAKNSIVTTLLLQEIAQSCTEKKE